VLSAGLVGDSALGGWLYVISIHMTWFQRRQRLWRMDGSEGRS
jgi:hypothetical protein